MSVTGCHFNSVIYKRDKTLYVSLFVNMTCISRETHIIHSASPKQLRHSVVLHHSQEILKSLIMPAWSARDLVWDRKLESIADDVLL